MSEKHFVDVDLKEENKKVKIYVKKPTRNILSASDRYKAKIWNQCLTDGVLTSMELNKIIRDRGIWSDEKETRENQLIQEIADLEKKLYLDSGKKKVSEGKDLAIKIRQARITLRDFIAERVAFEGNTAEAIADNCKFDYLVSECTFHENGERVYKSIDDYNNQSEDEVANAAAARLAEMIYSLDPDFYKNLPENKWLQKFDLIDEDLHIINKEHQKVDIEGRLVDNEGNYLDADGKRVDKDGNRIEDDGTYVLKTEYVDDTVKKAVRKKIVHADS